MSGTILVAIDLEHHDNAIRALKEARVQAECCGADIHVCYVLSYGFYSYIKPFVVEEVMKDSIAHVKVELAKLINEAGLGHLSIFRHVLKGGVHQQILLLVEKLKPRYLILNAGDTHSAQGMTGPVTAQITRYAPCNLLILR